MALSSKLRPTTRTADLAGTFTEQGGFVIRQHNDRVEMVGVIDGLPVWIEASGFDMIDLQVLVG